MILVIYKLIYELIYYYIIYIIILLYYYIIIFKINKKNILFFLVHPAAPVALEIQLNLTYQLAPVLRVVQVDREIPDIIFFINFGTY